MYASKVKDQKLTFVVSGMLWRRSLVMQDQETKTLWSHILGTAMRGELKGQRLESIPSVITDWETWKKDYPETTVLKMSRTARGHGFTREFYSQGRRALKDFVVGAVIQRKAKAWKLTDLDANPAVNDRFESESLLICYDKKTSAAYVYDRKLGDDELSFEIRDGKLIDTKTKSEWEPHKGVAVSGPMKGKQLRPKIGIISFAKAWKAFHPSSTYYEPESK